jgi:hypothetical protein
MTTADEKTGGRVYDSQTNDRFGEKETWEQQKLRGLFGSGNDVNNNTAVTTNKIVSTDLYKKSCGEKKGCKSRRWDNNNF